jgi:hypothetical protein
MAQMPGRSPASILHRINTPSPSFLHNDLIAFHPIINDQEVGHEDR